MGGGSDFDFGVTIRGLATGQKHFGRYTLAQTLGRGGMGIVWLARDEALERDVALKFLPEIVAADPVAIDDLKRETRRSLELTHPGIVRVYDFVQDHSVAAISMEYVRGRTLAEMRVGQPRRAFDVGDIASWLIQICEALHYSHVHARVVHRDLKPANVMVDDRNRIKLTDFGISATVSDTVTRVSRLASSGGTMAYASPQQLTGEPPSTADDIYALGATIYELITSRPPFFTGNLMFQVQNRVPPPMAERRQDLEIAGADIPAHWESLIAAALAKNPQDRPPTIESFADRLTLTGTFPTAKDDGGARAPSWGNTITVVSRGLAPGPGTTPPPLPAGPTQGATPPPLPAEWNHGKHRHGVASAPSDPARRRRRPLSNILTALCSLLIPGLGQLVRGRWLKAVAMLGLAAALWLLSLGWIVHLWSAIDAALHRPE